MTNRRPYDRPSIVATIDGTSGEGDTDYALCFGAICVVFPGFPVPFHNPFGIRLLREILRRHLCQKT